MSPRAWLKASGYRYQATPFWVYVWRVKPGGQPEDVRRFTSLHRAARVLREAAEAGEGKV